MAIKSYDDLLNRIGGGYSLSQPIMGLRESTAQPIGGNNIQCHLTGNTKALPALPGGVTAYIPTAVSVAGSQNATYSILFAYLINLGSLDIAGPTFTDGSSMPTKTELGVSRTTSSAVFIEVTTALNATPGNMTVTYVDQDGNGAETTTAQALGGSSPVGSSGFIVLNSPDIGVRDITAATCTGGTTPTGVVRFWGVIPISMGGSTAAAGGLGEYRNLLTSTFNCQRLPGSATLGVFGLQANAKSVQGCIYFVGDS